MTTFVRQATPALQALTAYDPGHDLPQLRKLRAPGATIELGSNENAWGPSPKVLTAINQVSGVDIFRYPDPLATALRSRLALLHGISPAEVVLGNGSHELLMHLVQIFCAPGDELLHSRYGFAVYPIAARAVGAVAVAAEPRSKSDSMPLGHDLDAMASLISPRTKMICMANPNNPTGTWVTLADLQVFLGKVPPHVLVLVDEAYIDFANAPGLHSALALRQQFRQLIVTRTFSKAYGLAGLRIGYAIANREIIDLVNRLRESFNVNALALIAAEAALEDQAHLDFVVREMIAERKRVTTELCARGLRVSPSQGNFVLIDFGSDAAAIEADLLSKGIVVRPMLAYGLPNHLRVTIATRPENDHFLTALTL